MGLFSNLFSHHSDTSAEEPERVDTRRGPPYACAGCKRWAHKPLAFLNNGQSYCLECTKLLAANYGYRLVGQRFDDIKELEE